MTIMTARVAASIVCICLCVGDAHAQSAPNLTREQRELLHAVVLAVESTTSQSPTQDAAWQTHVLRASDGSHYVAFTARPPAAMPLPAGPAVLYVRLSQAIAIAPRRAIADSRVAGRKPDGAATNRAKRHRDRRDADLRPDR